MSKGDIQFSALRNETFSEILSDGAVEFICKLHRKFEGDRQSVLKQREDTQRSIDKGELPVFLEETKSVRDSGWTVDDVPEPLQDRRVEITGPSGNKKMVINALNSGAHVFMADLEDANSPTWENQLQGQVNLYEAIRKTIDFTAPNGKEYKLNDTTATLIVRPRGWHLNEMSVEVDGTPMSGSLFDFGLYFYHNAKELLSRGLGPYFYLPKLESYKEARLWNNVFNFAQDELGVPRGTIKATVLIETLHGAFQADEILYELREHSAGLNCGRWDYIFSYIKILRNHEKYILPDRSEVTMTVNFMRAYTLYVVKTCHKRNAHAIGGMAAQIPIKNDEEANNRALEKVRADKEREVKDGHDGTWVAHPALVSVAKEVFDKYMPEANQRSKQRDDVHVTAEDLLSVPKGQITEEGLRANISVGLQYIEAWLRGFGAVPIHNLMEDVATAEISRAQVWQWIQHPEGKLEEGTDITEQLVSGFIDEELEKIKINSGDEVFSRGRFPLARNIFEQLVTQKTFTEFLTLVAYPYLDKQSEGILK
ncbi:malate synthase A [Alteribacter keqinensis]|uniref:Malate synthase n=1 Tax=Alteribacter keqinensis TaxID=2483800 RepID=A0A3M7U0E8_9BACI|nr:malate synthase A [Alteribacter keqinensis]RNA70474.1 malate synthase A [Alteribacter keqinensis]